MPVVKPNKVLPGSDPKFHVIRMYMTPVIYKGREIMGYVASCKHDGCRWSATYADNEARERGIHKHRSERVLIARLDHFARTMTDPDKIEDAILQAADKYSHTYEDWLAAVDTIWSHYTDRSLETRPAYNSQVQYHMGYSAQKAARTLVDREYQR